MIATLQMVDRICEVALFLSDQEVQDLTWSDFVASCTQPELVQYLKERRLYVNERWLWARRCNYVRDIWTVGF